MKSGKRWLGVGLGLAAGLGMAASAQAQNFDWNLINDYSTQQIDGRIDDLDGLYYLEINQENPPSPHSMCDDQNCDTIILYNADGTKVGETYFLEGTGSPDVFQQLVHNIVDESSYGTTEEETAVIVATETLRTAVTQTTNLITSRIAQIIAPRGGAKPQVSELDGATGLAAGDAGKGLAVWANASYTDSKDSDTTSKSESDLRLGMLGVDFKPMESMAVGMALGYEDGSRITYFNNGETTNDGFTVAPYFAYLVNDYFSFDLTAGYSWIDNDKKRNFGVISGDFDSERWFVSANVHGYLNKGNWDFVGTLGYTMANEDQDAYTESGPGGVRIGSTDIDLDTVNVGVEVGYTADSIQPYATLVYSYDTDYEDVRGVGYDRDAFTAGLGFRVQITDNLTGDFSATSMLGRTDESETALSGNLRYEF